MRCPLVGNVVLVVGSLVLGCSAGRTQTGSVPSGIETHAAASEAPSVPSPPPVLLCGSHTCKVPSEVCCLFLHEVAKSVCVPATSPDTIPAEAVGPSATDEFGTDRRLYLAAQASEQACTTAAGGRPDRVLSCDSSADCPGNQRCCTLWAGSGNSLHVCTAGACHYGELCVDSEPCRTPGTSCSDGTCKLTHRTVDCAGTPCAAPHVCCGVGGGESPPTCIDEAACRARHNGELYAYDCSGPSSCPAGAICSAFMMYSSCNEIGHGGIGRVLCESDAECARACEGSAHPGRDVCERDESGMRACLCKP